MKAYFRYNATMSNGKSKDSLPDSMPVPESDRLSKNGVNRNGNGQQTHNSSEDRFQESSSDQLKDTEYIPNQIVSMTATSGVNTVSNDRSGQCSSQNVRDNEGITDSKTYRQSQALYETDTKDENKDEPASKKGKSDSDDISHIETETHPYPEKFISTNNQEEHAENCESIISNDNINKSVSNASPNSYIPSEYGSFQHSGGISTFTKSCSSAKGKTPTQSTDSSNVKGGIVHEDTVEK